MSVAEVVQRLLPVEDSAARTAILSCALATEDADALLAALKAEAERQWTIDPHASLRIAEALILGASLAARPDHHALGLMAKADAIRCLGRYPESLEYFEAAANQFMTQRDEVGWARTRIGWLLAMHALGNGTTALPVAARAKSVLVAHHEWLRAAGLTHNTAIVYFRVGQYARSLKVYDETLEFLCRAEQADDSTRDVVAVRSAWTTANKARVLCLLVDFDAAIPLHEHAYRLFVEHGETVSAFNQLHNVAQVYAGRGQLTRALRMLTDAVAEAERTDLDILAAGCLLAGHGKTPTPAAVGSSGRVG